MNIIVQTEPGNHTTLFWQRPACPETRSVKPPRFSPGMAEPPPDLPLVSRGVGATLSYLATIGAGLRVASGKDPEASAARPRDNRPRGGTRYSFEHIQLEYRDDKGNLLDPKEAYKELSHKFHGKVPGKQKQEKKMRRLEQQQKQLASTLSDTPLGTAEALRSKQRALGTAYITLAKGSRGVRQDEIEIDPVDRTRKPGPGDRVGGGALPEKRPRVFGMVFPSK